MASRDAFNGDTNMNPIEQAVAPHRQASIDRALEQGRKMVAGAYEQLEAAGWDLNIAAPRPLSTMRREAYKYAQAKENFFRRLVTPVDQTGCVRFNAPEPVIRNIEGEKAFLADVANDASLDFDAYIAKLNAKIGECTEAKLDSGAIWNGSILTVTKADGTTENWKTKMIINVSCLGKLFNQWPTRKMK
jgi:hypothetical protein